MQHLNAQKETVDRQKKAVAASPGPDMRAMVSQTFVIYMKTYALHWNYVGPKFFGVHTMTEAQYKELAEAVDTLAERMRALRELAPISLKQILEHADLHEFDNIKDADAAIAELARSHRQIARLAKETAEVADDAGDAYTHDLLVSRVGVHEKFAWMLESYVS